MGPYTLIYLGMPWFALFGYHTELFYVSNALMCYLCVCVCVCVCLCVVCVRVCVLCVYKFVCCVCTCLCVVCVCNSF